MTICPGGLTQAKSGVAAFVNLGSSGASLLAAIPRLSLLAPIAYALTGVSLTTSVLCGSEPPGFPTFTQDEVNDLLNNNFFDLSYASAVGKLKDMLATIAWYQLCECQSGGAVTIPTPPVQPTPPLTVPTDIPNTSVVCVGPTTRTDTFAGFPSVKTSANFVAMPLPASAVQVHIKVTTSNNGGGVTSSITGHVFKYTPTNAGETLLDTFTIPIPGVYEAYYPVDPTKPVFHYDLNPANNPSPGDTFAVLGEAFCGGSVAPGPLSCCPPDPLLVAKLDNIQALVTLLQRQLAPFAYVPGAVHTGLSGNGVLSVQGLLGAKIHITTDPTTLGVEGTSPPILFDRGFITWGTADGYPQSERLERTSQLSLPARASAFTDLAYDLHPGVIVTITELVREA